MNKLTIEELAVYLPFNLKLLELRKVKFENDKNVSNIYIMNNGNIMYPIKDKVYRVLYCKPLVKPIEDAMLPESLSELGKWLFESQSVYFERISEAKAYIEILLINNKQNITNLPYYIFIKLVSMHFDVFRWIPAGLAIDLKTTKI